jgi:glycosyltransferase involved in cell wall biosynthesis
VRILLVASLAESLLNFRGHLITALQSRGLIVHVAAPQLDSKSETRRALEARGVIVHDIPMVRAGMSALSDAKTFLAMYHLMFRVRPEIFLGYTIKPVLYGTIAAWLIGIPRRFALITGLGFAFTGQAKGLRGVIKTIVQILYKIALKRSHKVFFQNPDDRDLFYRLGLVQPYMPSVVVNGSGVDVDGFASAPMPRGEVHFLLIARLLGDKGVREYAEAAQRIKAMYPTVRFSLAGWIDENPDAIAQSELDEWVNSCTLEYLGRLQDVRPAIAACSVYVLPSSYREGTPRTVLEAMAMGRAVITSDAPGCRETVVVGKNGFLVPLKDTEALVQAMRRFIEHPSLVNSMGSQSRKIAEEKYDVHKVNALMLSEMGL